MVIKLRKRTDEEIKESDDYTRMVQESFALDQHNAYLKSKAKEEKPKKSKTDLKKLVKEVKATKMPETFIPEIKSMKEKLKELTKLASKPKKELKKLVKANEEHLEVFPSMKDKEEQKMTKRVLTMKTDHKRDVSNVSSLVRQYVDEYKHILDNVSNKGGSRQKKIDKLRTKLYSSSSPSDIRDATTLIKELKKDYIEEPKPKKKPVVKSGSADDLHDKVVKYVKGQIKKGTLESMETGYLFYIAEEVISKGVTSRLSLKIIKSIIDE